MHIILATDLSILDVICLLCDVAGEDFDVTLLFLTVVILQTYCMGVSQIKSIAISAETWLTYKPEIC